MQTVTSPVLSSSQPLSKSIKHTESKDSESRGHVFAENLQKAKLDSRASSNPSQENTSTKSQLSSSKNDSKTNELPSSDADSINGHTVPIDHGKVTTQEKVIDSGNGLHNTGQNSPDDAPLEEGRVAESDTQQNAEGELVGGTQLGGGTQKVSTVNVGSGLVSSNKAPRDSVTDKTSQAAVSLAGTSVPSDVSQTTTPIVKEVKASTSPEIAKQAQAIAKEDGGATELITADPSLQKSQGNPGGVEGSSAHRPATHSSVTGQNEMRTGASLTAASVLEPVTEAKVLSGSVPTSEPISETNVVEGNLVEGNALEVNTLEASESADAMAPNGLVTSQVLTTSPQPAKTQDAEILSDKVPAEVRALYANKDKPFDVTAGLASIGLAAKGGNAMGTRGSLGKDDAALSLNKDSGVQPTELTGADDGGELSWVLSQMGNSTSAAAENAGMTSKDGLSAIPAATTKVADQVALANDAKGTQALVAGPLILGGVVNGQAEGADGDANLASAIDTDALAANEPLALRKKEQDALIGKMTNQLDGSAKETDLGGLNSSITATNNTANRLSPAAPNMQAMNAPQNLAMSVPPNHTGWAGEMSQKVAFVAQSGGHTAHIKLDPPELGSLTVKVSVDSDNNNTQVSFMAATPQARDLLESQMGRLRDMLAQQGMDLDSVDVGVSQQDTSGGQYQDTGDGAASSNAGRFLAGDEGDDDLAPQNISYISPSGVDYYA